MHIFGYLNTLLSMERVVNVIGDMTDKSCYLRQRIFPGLVCERKTSDSSSSGGICGCFKVFNIFSHTQKHMIIMKNLKSWIITNRDPVKKLITLLDYLKIHSKEIHIINMCIICVLCFIILSYGCPSWR